MAYQLVAARVRSKSLDAGWSDLDVGALTLNELYLNYSKVYLTLSNVVIPDPVYLDMAAVRDQIAPSMLSPTVNDWLAGLGNTSLPTITALPETTLNQVGYTDMWYAGYKAVPSDHLRNPQSQAPISSLNDLLITKDGVDFQQFWNYCLVTVNGLLHRVGGSPYGLYVLRGNESAVIRNDNQLGLMSFLKVGALTTYPITADMIYKTNDNQKFSNRVHVKLPVSVENKTVLLVLGGYIHVLDETYRMVSDRSFTVDMNNYPFPERVFEALGRINLSSMQLNPPPGNAEQFALDDLYSDRAIKAWFTLPQSFVVVVDTPNFYVRHHALERLKVPGRFVNHELQRFPLISAMGRIYDYFIQPEQGSFVYSTEAARDIEYNFRTFGWESTLSIDPTRYSAKPWRLARGSLLEMGSYSN